MATNAVTIHREALRRAGRDETVAALRDGRMQRAGRIPSGKVYRRRDKHQGRNDG